MKNVVSSSVDNLFRLLIGLLSICRSESATRLMRVKNISREKVARKNWTVNDAVHLIRNDFYYTHSEEILTAGVDEIFFYVIRIAISIGALLSTRPGREGTRINIRTRWGMLE